ncbi:hypothetical protein [Actinokineospora sp. UTMC 2448]|uniref:hypothetical protein n=1 Tax=Actinokineospora sp. UTMC 2448 TaxID=2268449 RepID=UPI0021645932|nr:hypothetical protein [Actinokineospora sp. UTMC 2448]
MLKVDGMAPCGGSTVEVDPWVPLKVSWHVNRDVQPLYLFVAGTSGGYLELKVHPESGAFSSLTVIDLPVELEAVEMKAPAEVRDGLVPILDVTSWGCESGVLRKAGGQIARCADLLEIAEPVRSRFLD